MIPLATSPYFRTVWLSPRPENSGVRAERDYCLAWFLVALSQELLGQSLVFKGLR